MNWSVYTVQTEYAIRIGNKCIKFKDHDRNTTFQPRISGVQSGVKELRGLYPGTCVMVPINKRCSALKLT